MSEKTKAELVREELKPYATIEDMKAKVIEIAEKIGCSKSLVYKEINKIIKERPSEVLPQPKEAVIKIPKAEEIEIPLEEEQMEEAVRGWIEAEEPEPEPEEVKEVEEAEKLSEEAQRLGDIFTRSIERFLNVPMGYLELKEIGITHQEADDSAFLILLLLGKHTNFQTSENFLEITTATHFGSIGLRGFIEWYKKRQEEAAKKKLEEPKQEPREPEPKEQLDIEDKKQAQKPSFLKRL